MRIWKWTLASTDIQTLHLPVGAQVLTVQAQGECAQLWALCHEKAEKEPRRFAIYGTGNPIPDEPGIYVGTYQLMDGRLVLHVFELI